MTRFKVLLVKRGVKQKDLAEALGWSKAKVGHFATGYRIPSDEDTRLMAESLRMHVANFRRACGW